MSSEIEIRVRLVDVLSGRLSLPEFEEWLVAKTWNASQTSQRASELAAAIELALFDYSSGYLDEAELMGELRQISGSILMSLFLGPATMAGQPMDQQWIETKASSHPSPRPGVVHLEPA